MVGHLPHRAEVSNSHIWYFTFPFFSSFFGLFFFLLNHLLLYLGLVLREQINDCFWEALSHRDIFQMSKLKPE